MNPTKIFTVVLATLIFAIGCVQKTYKRTIVVTLDVSGTKDIKQVGIRGNFSPLSWDSDLEMTAIKKDSLYTTTFTTTTGYRFAKVKFSINGEMELKDKDERKINYSDKDTTYYHARFNKGN